MQLLKSSKYNITICESAEDIVIYNCNSGKVVRMPIVAYKKLNDVAFQQKNNDFFDYLCKFGIVVPFDMDEYNCLRIKERLICDNFDCQELDITLAPTLKCNMRCSYCFEKGKSEDAKELSEIEFSEKTYAYLIKAIDRIKHLKVLKITWFGGEPLLCYNTIVNLSAKMIELCGNNGIELQTRIITNGALLTKERIEHLANKCNLVFLQISLDGQESSYCKVRGVSSEAYKKVIENICLSAQYTHVRVRLNATKHNTEELKNLANYLCLEKGLKDKIDLSFAEVHDYEKQSPIYFDIGEFREKKREFQLFLSQSGCVDKMDYSIESFYPLGCKYFCFHNVAIDPQGYLYKCEHRLGERTSVVGDIDNGFYYNDIQVASSQQADSDGRCKKCSIYPICGYSFCSDMRRYMGDKECICYDQQIPGIIRDVLYCVKKSNATLFYDGRIKH